jgi:hypothetical protein
LIGKFSGGQSSILRPGWTTDGLPVIANDQQWAPNRDSNFSTNRFLASQLVLGLSADQELAFEGADGLQNSSTGVGFAYEI